MIDSRQVGRRIAELRQGSGLTQMQLAAMMNVSHQAVSKWEGGAALPDIQTLLDLTRFFGVTVEQLTGTEIPEESEESEAERNMEEERPKEAEANNMNIQQLLQMAPYMTKEAVAEIAMGMEEPLTAGQIARIAPYLTPECVEALVEKHHPEFTWDSLRRLAPHIRRETVDELARAIASGRETVKSSEDSFNKTMSDIGRAFDDLGRGVDKAVRKAIRFGGSVLSEVSSALNDLSGDTEDAKVRSERAKELRRRAFERALADGRWDWLGEHIDELADGDELRQRIAARARELGMRDWIDAHLGGCADEQAVEAAVQAGDWDWLGENLARMEPAQRLRAARAAVAAQNWDWLERHCSELDLGAELESFVRKVWRGGSAELALKIAREGFDAAEQYDALFREAVAADTPGVADALWGDVSPDCARERLLELAARQEWDAVKRFVDYADREAVEKLTELAVEQGDFDAVDFLDAYL